MSCSLHAYDEGSQTEEPADGGDYRGTGKPIGNPSGAIMILLPIAPLLASVTTIVTSSFAHNSLVTVSKHLFLIGLFASFCVLSITFISSHFGVGNAVFFSLLGQVIGSLIIG